MHACVAVQRLHACSVVGSSAGADTTVQSADGSRHRPPAELSDHASALQVEVDVYRRLGQIKAQPVAGCWLADALNRWRELNSATHFLQVTQMMHV